MAVSTSIENILRRLHAITCDGLRTPRQKLDALLAMGREYFSLPTAMLIRAGVDGWEVELVQGDAPDSHGWGDTGEDHAFLEAVLKSGGPAHRSGIRVGMAVSVAGAPYGVLVLAGSKSRNAALGEQDEEVLKLISECVSSLLEIGRSAEGGKDDHAASRIRQLEYGKVVFEAMFASIPDAVIFADRNRRIRMVNPAFERIFGYGTTELLGQTTETIYLHPDDYREQGRVRFNPGAAVSSFTYEMWYRRKTGEAFVGETSGVPIRDEEGVHHGMVAVIRDATDRRESAEKVERARRYLQALYDASPDMIFLHAPDGRLLDVNENVVHTLGYSREEILATPIGAVSGAGYTQSMADERIRCAMDGERCDFEWVMVNRDGTEIPVDVRLRRLGSLDDEGVSGVIAVARDVSAVKATMNELQQERDFSTAVLDTIGSMVVVLDRGARIVRFNSAAQKLTGYTEQEMQGEPIWGLVPSDQRSAVKRVFKRLLSGDFPSQYENAWLTREGERRMLFWNNSALQNEGGEVEYVIAAGIDITEQRLAEKALARARMEWNEATEFFRDPVYIVDLDDSLVRANRAFFELVGKPPEELIGMRITDIMHPEGEDVPCPVCQARRARRDIDIVMEADHPDNPVGLPIEVSLRVIRDHDGGPLGILMGMRDLSRQRQIEEELREHRDNLELQVRKRTAALESANRELESFSYSVSHDLRSPLRSIDGFSHALLEEYGDRFDDMARDYLTRLRRASQRMGMLIDDLLLLSRVGRSAMEFREIDLSAMTRAILDDLCHDFPEHGVTVMIEDGMRLAGDARLIQQLMENLLANAWKFTSKRQDARIEVGSRKDRRGQAIFHVRDNGVGFDMRYADKLFGAFQRLHSDAEFAGTGVGLATAQRIVNRHGGRIWAESRPGEGAVFYFTLGEDPGSGTGMPEDGAG